MERIDGRTFSGGAVLGWLSVGAYGVWEIASEAAGEGGEIDGAPVGGPGVMRVLVGFDDATRGRTRWG